MLPAELVDRELGYIVGRADGRSVGRSVGRTAGRSDGRSDGRFGAIFDHLGSILCHPGSPKSPQTYRLIPRGSQRPPESKLVQMLKNDEILPREGANIW